MMGLRLLKLLFKKKCHSRVSEAICSAPRSALREPGGQIWTTPERMAAPSLIRPPNLPSRVWRWMSLCQLHGFWSVTAGPFGTQFTLSPQGVGREAKSYFALLFLFLLREKVRLKPQSLPCLMVPTLPLGLRGREWMTGSGETGAWRAVPYGTSRGLRPHVASLIAASGSGPRSLHVGRPAAAVTSRRQLAGGMQAGARTDKGLGQGLGQGRRRLAEEIRKATLPVPATQSASGGREGSVGP